MSFTEEERELLDSLLPLTEKVEINIKDVNYDPGYEVHVRSYLRGLAQYYGLFKAYEETDWEAEFERRRKAVEEKAAARAEEVREGIVLSFMSGLVPKVYKVYGEVQAKFLGSRFSVGNEEFSMVYNRAEKKLYTWIEGVAMFEDDMTNLSGNCSPRQQSEGYNAVWIYLEERTKRED